MNIHILFGITGDLSRKKVIPALKKLSDELMVQTGADQIFCIGAGRKPEPPQEFLSLPKSSYVQGDLFQKKLYQKIAKTVEKDIVAQYLHRGVKEITLTIYSSLPPDIHEPVIKNAMEYIITVLSKKIKTKYKKNLKVKIAIEKPLGTGLQSAKHLIQIFEGYKDIADFYYVDHYLAKDALIELESIGNTNPLVLESALTTTDIQEITVHLYEKIGIEGRGNFYDPVGALYDVGQNHLLQVLARTILLQMQIISASKSTVQEENRKEKIIALPSIATILNSLAVQGQIVFGQYKGYQDVEAVPKGSKTETFFHVSFSLVGSIAKKFPGLSSIKYTISAGKALSTSKSGIEIIAKKKKLHIDFAKGIHDAYFNVFKSIYEGNHMRFADADSILASWKIAERIKKLKTKSDLIVYTNTRDIIS